MTTGSTRKKYSWDDKKLYELSGYVNEGAGRYSCGGGFDRIRVVSEPEAFEVQNLRVRGRDGKVKAKPRPVPCSTDKDYILNRDPNAPEKKRRFCCVIVHVAHRDKESEPWTPVQEAKWWAFSPAIRDKIQALKKSLPEGKGLVNVDVEVSLENSEGADTFQKLVFALLLREEPMLLRSVRDKAIKETDEIMERWTTPLSEDKIRQLMTGEYADEASSFEFGKNQGGAWTGGDTVDDGAKPATSAKSGEMDVDLDGLIDEAAAEGVQPTSQKAAEKPTTQAAPTTTTKSDDVV